MDRLVGRLAGAAIALAASALLAACAVWLWRLALGATTDAAITLGVLGGVWAVALAGGGVVTALVLALRRPASHPTPPLRALVPADTDRTLAPTTDLGTRRPA